VADEPASQPVGAVFLSYASEDAVAAERIADALRARGVEVWFDKTELRGGDSWDQKIRRQIRQCALFVPIISAHSEARLEGYFRREWKLASDRTQDMADEQPFLVPVVIDHTSERTARVPDRFRDVQWSRLPLGQPSNAFVDLVSQLLASPPLQSFKPEGVSHQQRVLAHAGPSARIRRGTILALVALITIAGGLFMAFHLTTRTEHPAAAGTTTSAAPIPQKSVAVLPFVDMSEKKDEEYFSDGLAEELIDMLAKVPDLSVPARTSSFYFKGKPTKLSQIAHELGVANLLEGSVRKSNNRIRVTVQLIRADTGYHLWSETYDRELSGVFEVQDEIANAVAQTLQITLLGGPIARQKGGTENLDAYLLYLRALDAHSQNTAASLQTATGYLDQAVKLDPNFGLAWAAMALNVIVETDNGLHSPQDGYERARQLAQRALESSEDLGVAHAALQYVHRTYDWDWGASEAEGRQALRVDPTNQLALMFSGMLSTTLGEWAAADRELRASLARDPLNTYVNANLGDSLYSAGRFADAEAAYRKVLQLAPRFAWARMSLSKILLAEGKTAAALATVQADEDKGYQILMLPILLQANGRKTEADNAFRQLLKTNNTYFIALTYAYRGDREHALEALGRSYNEKDANLVMLVGEPLLKTLNDDPRYTAFLRKMNLRE
jgi:TolB-like protein/Tfp pilus assembly protein PilF